MPTNKSPLQNRRIVVTGGAGFLGSFVIETLRRRGCENVFVPRRHDYDLRDRDAILRLYDDALPDIVIHLAAVVGGIGANRENPGRFFYDNAIMGIQLMEYARQRRIEKFVATGTICAYPKYASIPFKEDEAIYLLPVNLYGPRDNFDLATSHVIPALIRKFTEAKERAASSVVLWGDGTPTREFLYVEDAAEGIVLATEAYDGELPVNLGTGEEIAIRDLAQMIASEVGFTGGIVWDKTKPNGQPRRALDVSRAKEQFGFESAHQLKEGISKTVAWFMTHRRELREVTFA